MKILFELFSFAVPMVVFAWVLPKRFILFSQIIITALFIAYKSPFSLLILTAVSLGNFFLLHRLKANKAIKISISIILMAGMLYTEKILVAIEHNWVIPLGMSYYIFRNIHYTLEYYKGRMKDEGMTLYLAYNFFLPVFVVGPINRYPDFVKDWQRRRFNPEYFSAGTERILYGLSKILILGNFFFTFWSLNFIAGLNSHDIWLKTYLETIRFILNGYFQFAGYSDIAIGLSLLLGFRIIENFNYPFLSTNMAGFWTRYHISLSSFCRDYIYTPIMSYYRKPILGIVFTMLMIGLWHEISFHYLIWALMQSAGIYLATFFNFKNKSAILTNLGRVFVLNYFAISCVIVAHDSFSDTLNIYKILFFIR